MFFQKVPFCVRPFLAFFAHFRPILSYFWTSEASKHRKHTNCTYLCAKSSKKYMKMVSNSYLEFWPSQGPKNPTGPKNAPKMTGESWNWPQCTSCGLTNMFWPKKINSETVTSKPVFLVRNCPRSLTIQHLRNSRAFLLHCLQYCSVLFYPTQKPSYRNLSIIIYLTFLI